MPSWLRLVISLAKNTRSPTFSAKSRSDPGTACRAPPAMADGSVGLLLLFEHAATASSPRLITATLEVAIQRIMSQFLPKKAVHIIGIPSDVPAGNSPLQAHCPGSI